MSWFIFFNADKTAKNGMWFFLQRIKSPNGLGAVIGKERRLFNYSNSLLNKDNLC